ncbi:MAG TPA: class I SAM-dependent methyltransferase [Bryobacteraceae bacterium]
MTQSPTLWEIFRYYAQRATIFPLEAVLETLHLRLGPLNPPRRVDPNGGGDFLGIGREFCKYFIELGDLRPEHSVLDVGSGCGRMAVPLLDYLTSGTYDGIEIMKKSVTWCRRAITPRHPNFRFHHADILNREYNPSGRLRAEDYRFPFPDPRFDFIFLTSVFTHMLPPSVENYLREIARVLKPGGRCLITWFLLDETSRKLSTTEKSQLNFKFDFGNYRSTHKRIPEYAVAYDQDFAVGLYNRCSLVPRLPPYYGCWSGRERKVSFQDIIVATREEQRQ